jgi:S-formylglutathione hydrolase FrmB
MVCSELSWFSQILGMHVTTRVLLPDRGRGPFATFYLLHGLSDDHTMWHRRTRVEMYAAALPLIIVMPQGFRGFYTDNEAGPAYARYIGEELPAMIERTFPAKRTRRGRCIGGLSMGGYGALRIALGYPHRFVSVNSHSGAVMHGTRSWSGQGTAAVTSVEMRRVFGARPRGSSHDLLELARRARRSSKPLPRILIDCGTEDHLLEYNRALHAGLNKLAIAHEYREFLGGHDWDYWDAHVREALRFHADALGLQ